MSGPVRIVGLGPAGLDRVSDSIRSLLDESSTPVVGRTLDHPASVELDALRPVIWCDDLYESSETFEEVYDMSSDGTVRIASVQTSPRLK